MDCDENDSATMSKRNLENAEKSKQAEAKKDLELAAVIDQGVQDEKKDKEKALANDFNSGELHNAHPVAHNIRYSSFMDQQSSNQARIHDQKMQQKQWLDQQIAERKCIDRDHKKTEKLAQKSIEKYDAHSSSQYDRVAGEKRDMQNQIREYNETMALQKRARDKQEKEMEKREYNDNHSYDLRKDKAQRQRSEDAKEELIQKERAMSRDMLQMNTSNQKNWRQQMIKAMLVINFCPQCFKSSSKSNKMISWNVFRVVYYGCLGYPKHSGELYL